MKKITFRGDLFVGLYLLAAIILFIIPIPSLLLDILITFNIMVALFILFNCLYASETLDMSSFPTILLFSTVFRIALNISSTKLILTTGDPGVVVKTFGNFVGGGNLVVGAIIFVVLVIVRSEYRSNYGQGSYGKKTEDSGRVCFFWFYGWCH